MATVPLDGIVGRRRPERTDMELVAKLRYMGRQYANGQAARGGGQQKHYLEEAADEIEALRAKAARWDAIETLMILGDVELTQTEDGGYSIYVEPVENILPTSWNGDTPDQVADKVAAQLTTPNAKVSGGGAFPPSA